MNLTSTYDGEWFFVSHRGNTLAVFPHWTAPDRFCIGERSGTSEYALVGNLDDFENPQAAIDHAEWMLGAAA